MPYEVLLSMAGDLSWRPSRDVVLGNPTPVTLHLAVKVCFVPFESESRTDLRLLILESTYLSKFVQTSKKCPVFLLRPGCTCSSKVVVQGTRSEASNQCFCTSLWPVTRR